jgi:hypothetical protein
MEPLEMKYILPEAKTRVDGIKNTADVAAGGKNSESEDLAIGTIEVKQRKNSKSMNSISVNCRKISRCLNIFIMGAQKNAGWGGNREII